MPVVCTAAPSCGSGCAAVDASPNDNTLSIQTPAAFVDGKFGGGATAAAPNDPCGGRTGMTATATGMSAGDGAETVELWMRGGLYGANDSDLMGRGDRYLVLTPSGVEWLDSGCTVAVAADDRWHFVAATYAAGTATLSIDGGAAKSCGVPARATASTDRISLGGGINCRYAGWLDEVRVSTRALAPAEIAADFAGGILQVTADTAALWHFDEGAATRCCPAGSPCDPSGGCGAAPIAGASSACPGSAPNSCHDGTCCPDGFSCAGDGVCAPVDAPVCPDGTSVDCGDGKCCPSGELCDQGACIASIGVRTQTRECADNMFAYGVNAIPIDASTALCCPPATPLEQLSTDQTCFPGQQYRCVTTPSNSFCPYGYDCFYGTTCVSSITCGGQCAAWGTQQTCPDGGVLCGGNRCCPGGMICAESTQSVCCPPGQIACGYDTNHQALCCPPSGIGTEQPKVCAAGTTACGAECCPGGSVCSNGQCQAVPAPQAVCANGLTCGDTCCPTNTRCASPGVCVAVPEGPPCPAGFSGACSGVGPCCRDGFVCMGASGGSGGFYCVGDGVARGGPTGPACGGAIDYCPQGDVCSAGACCPPDHPVECGGACCLDGASCAGGGCGCPPSLPLACGASCCDRSSDCVNGQCVQKCADGRDACGAECCASGIACSGGHCACPADHPQTCGNECCLAGAACHDGACGCPNGRLACGDQCCGEGQTCNGGKCADPVNCGGDDYAAPCPGGGSMCCSQHMVCCHDAANGGAIGCQFKGFCE